MCLEKRVQNSLFKVCPKGHSSFLEGRRRPHGPCALSSCQGFTDDQLVLVEQNTLLVEEREREIRQIVQSISDLSEIFRDLGAMIVEQVREAAFLIGGVPHPNPIPCPCQERKRACLRMREHTQTCVHVRTDGTSFCTNTR